MTFFYSGSESGKHENGVGIIIHDSILLDVNTFKAINERLCYIILKGRIFYFGIICCYWPTEDKQDEKKEEFLEELERAYDNIPRHYIKALLGDFNSKREITYKPIIGSESFHYISNDNGTRLRNMAIVKDLIISSTYFPQKDITKYHILIDKKHREYVNNVRSYKGVDANTDHYF